MYIFAKDWKDGWRRYIYTYKRRTDCWTLGCALDAHFHVPQASAKDDTKYGVQCNIFLLAMAALSGKVTITYKYTHAHTCLYIY